MVPLIKNEFVFQRNIDLFAPINKKALENTNIYEKLPGGNYTVERTMDGQFYLKMIGPFEHPKKIYGNALRHADRIRRTFENRPAATGVLLSGEKGSGKTLLARTICIEAARDGIPTIVINAPWAGDAFYTFLSSITQPCIVLFDEFEKTYDVKKNEQDSILTLLDGVFPSKKLFLLTCNDRYGINTNMINRPGRIFYALEFTGLDESFIREYTEDNLVDKTKVDSVVRITKLFSQFNFDMLKALIEEMNRYEETAADALTLLNVSPAYDYLDYRATVTLASGEVILPNHTHPDKVRSPMACKQGMHFSVYAAGVAAAAKLAAENGPKNAESDQPMTAANVLTAALAVSNKRVRKNKEIEYEEVELTFMPGDVCEVEGDSMVFINKVGHKLTLTRERVTQYDWRQAADLSKKRQLDETDADSLADMAD